MHTISSLTATSRATTPTYRTNPTPSTKIPENFGGESGSSNRPALTRRCGLVATRTHRFVVAGGFPLGLGPAIRRPVPRWARETLEMRGALVKSRERGRPARRGTCALCPCISRGERPRNRATTPRKSPRGSSSDVGRGPGWNPRPHSSPEDPFPKRCRTGRSRTGQAEHPGLSHPDFRCPASGTR